MAKPKSKPHAPTSAKIGRKEEEREAWTKFLDFCTDHARSSWWFRGVSDTSHTLVPSIGRNLRDERWYEPTKPRTIDHFTREKRLLRAFQRRARLELRIPLESKLEWLAIAQHHGVPTRLLDWTPNPLMAAWFATNSKVDQKTARIYAAHVTPSLIRDEEGLDPFDRKQSEPCFVIAPHWHQRVRAQRGCFSIHPTPNAEWNPKSPRIDHIDVPYEFWGAFQQRLFYFGIDASTVMADLPGVGSALAWQFANNIGTGAVGY